MDPATYEGYRTMVTRYKNEVSTIVSQQISTEAAGAIMRRLRDLLPVAQVS